MASKKDEEPEVNAALEEGDESAEGGEGAESEGGKGKKKLILFIVAGLLALLIAGGAGAYFLGFLDPLLGKTPAQVCTKDEHGVETCVPAAGEQICTKDQNGVETCTPAPTAHGAEGGEGAAAEQVCTKDESGKEVCSAPGAKFLKIPDMIVNLNSEDGTPRYLRLSVQLEFKNSSDMAEVEKVMPRVVDQFQTYLRELRVKDLRGSAGIYRLQMELLSRVNQASYPVEVQGVLFQEILIQ